MVKTSVPLIVLAQAGKPGYFDDAGFPVGHGGDEIALSAVIDEHAYALEISGNSIEPAYRDNTVLVLSPTAFIRRGDRVVLKTRRGRGHGPGAQPAYGQVDRVKIGRSRAKGTRVAGARRAVDAPRHLGEPIIGGGFRASTRRFRAVRNDPPNEPWPCGTLAPKSQIPVGPDASGWVHDPGLILALSLLTRFGERPRHTARTAASPIASTRPTRRSRRPADGSCKCGVSSVA